MSREKPTYSIVEIDPTIQALLQRQRDLVLEEAHAGRATDQAWLYVLTREMVEIYQLAYGPGETERAALHEYIDTMWLYLMTGRGNG